jgi:hypothetical protein
MAYSLVVAGGTLYKITPAGVATALTLPTGITISATRPSYLAIVQRNIALVNGPTRSLLIDPNFNVYPLIPQPPTTAPLLADGGAGTYSGTVRARYTFIIKDPVSGKLIAESPFSPISASLTVTNKLIQADLQTSPDSAVTHRRLYRTTTGGSTYFHWLDVDGNTQTSIKDDLSDAAIGLVAAPTHLGAAPGMALGTFMTNIVEWKDRLWGVGDIDPDVLVFTNENIAYGWPNSLNVPPVGADEIGITGLLTRRDELGIAKRHVLWKLVKAGTNTFDLIKVKSDKGCWAPRSVVIIDDIAYFLGEDGVYTWGPGGVQSISDARVRGWFSTDTYFNRGAFDTAIGRYNARYHWYEVLLAPAGSTDLTRWVAYDIRNQAWYGPHKTDAFTPSFMALSRDSNGLNLPIMGSTAGHVYYQDSTATTDQGTVLALEAHSKFHDGNAPDIEKVWLQPSVLSSIQAAAGAVNVTAKVGGLDASTTQTFALNLTRGREKLSRLGRGRMVQIGFSGSTSASQGIVIYGYELPYFELGRR